MKRVDRVCNGTYNNVVYARRSAPLCTDVVGGGRWASDGVPAT